MKGVESKGKDTIEVTQYLEAFLRKALCMSSTHQIHHDVLTHLEELNKRYP